VTFTNAQRPIRRTARKWTLRGAGITLAMLVGACGSKGTPQVVNGVTLLRFGYLNGSPAALLHGRVSFANGCVSLEDAPGVPVTGLWSSGARLDNSTGILRIIVNDVPFAEGDELSMGGGEYADEEFVVSLVGPIPQRCRGEHYWLLTDLATTRSFGSSRATATRARRQVPRTRPDQVTVRARR
jgi:hypothetical protein